MKRIFLFLVTCIASASPAYAAFDGPRVYWPLPKNTNIVSAHLIKGIANATWTSWNRISPGIDIQSDNYLLNYTRVQPVFGRTAYWQAFLPMGTLHTSSNLPLPSDDTFVNGLGDPALAGTVNIYGTPGLKAKEFIRHEPDLSINVGLNVTLPLGQYDGDQALNVGSNQWKTRLSFPIMKSLRPWVPGRRMTLELMPAVVFFTDNDEAQGNRIEQDPVVSIEGHLTHDMTQQAFLSLDYTRINGGDETYISKTTGLVVRQTSGLDANLLGVTLGFEINDHMRLFLTHMQTTSEDKGGYALEASLTKITLSWAWHDVLENVYQFKED